MVWSLFLLIFMGHCTFFTCQLYEYHFINESKTWKDAQRYCREHYTDLATVNNMTDIRRLHDEGSQDEAWIGLSKTEEQNKTWYWSLPGLKFNNSTAKWNHGEPNDAGGHENCVWMNKENWTDQGCNENHQFVCFNETEQSEKTYQLISMKKTWRQAQNYCRKNYTDLVSGLDQLTDDKFKEELEDKLQGNRTQLWIGLFRDRWKWSDGTYSSVRNWDLNTFKDEESNKKCATVLENGTWSSADCNETKPFFCYDDKVILIKENKTWPEALDYCRAHYTDLVSITDRHQQRWAEKRAEKAHTDFVWLGLRYTCTLDFWFWVSDEKVSYKNWNTTRTTDDCNMSAAMKKGGEYKWFTKKDDETFHFLCAVC